jgi:ferredoxin-NADP reductase
MRATFVKLEWENQAQTIGSFYFKPAGRYRYDAGQYAVLSVPHESVDNRGDSRTMTLSSSPNDRLLKMTMRVFLDDSSSFKEALLGLMEGDSVTIFEAMGDLVLPMDSSIPLVFVAGGVAIASYVGMMQWLLETRDQRDISLHYAVAGPDDVVMQKPFDDYATAHNLTRSLYTPNVNTPRAFEDFRGEVVHDRLTGDAILRQAKPDSLFYLSGTESMVENLRTQLIEKGISNQNIVFDYFDGYVEL